MSKITINVMDRKNKKHILEGEKGQTLMELIEELTILDGAVASETEEVSQPDGAVTSETEESDKVEE